MIRAARQLKPEAVFELDGRILGAQAIGADGADKRIDATAMSDQGWADGRGFDSTSNSPMRRPSARRRIWSRWTAMWRANVLSGLRLSIIGSCGKLARHSEVAPASIQLVDVRTRGASRSRRCWGPATSNLNRLRDRLSELEPSRPVVVSVSWAARLSALSASSSGQASKDGPQSDGWLARPTPGRPKKQANP